MDDFDSAGVQSIFGQEGGEWMPPSVALQSFEPPAGMMLAEESRNEEVRYGFRIGPLGLLIKAGCGSEVMQLPEIWSLPGAPPWLLGLINLRGNLVPVYELREILSLGGKPDAAKPLVLVFDQGDKAVGVVVDDFPKPLTSLYPLPHLPQLPTSLSGHVRMGYVQDEMIWLEFDQDSFFEVLTRQQDG